MSGRETDFGRCSWRTPPSVNDFDLHDASYDDPVEAALSAAVASLQAQNIAQQPETLRPQINSEPSQFQRRGAERATAQRFADVEMTRPVAARKPIRETDRLDSGATVSGALGFLLGAAIWHLTGLAGVFASHDTAIGASGYAASPIAMTSSSIRRNSATSGIVTGSIGKTNSAISDECVARAVDRNLLGAAASGACARQARALRDAGSVERSDRAVGPIVVMPDEAEQRREQGTLTAGDLDVELRHSTQP